ncbi:Hypothetical protein, putative [Bodo saltans]|uniref:Leucine-rich repeat protein n=1 Tax=Bodo saltans TaxID=75058 RepID=A0A0S4IUJ9_BODSA|nr:Hypothetical protein, putative [Bodo saltans]|eukprot:CUF93538.1 Hypothetical protein, putative [Bodo saltans]
MSGNNVVAPVPGSGEAAEIVADQLVADQQTEEQTEEGNEAAGSDGMRREWNFTFTIKHHAARSTLRLNPAWTSQFIDPDDIINLSKLDRDVKHCPMMPFAAYEDRTIALQSGVFWEESPKTVRIMYSHVQHNMSLKAYAKRSVQHVLGDPRVATVDGQAALQRLMIAKKMQHAPLFGGKPSFQFWYVVSDKTRARTEYVYAVGTICGQRGYLATVTCHKEAELQSYIKHFFLPHFVDTSKFAVDVDVHYEEVTNTVLKEQQELYGELHFHDRDAAVSFAIPMHPVTLKPDFSPIQSVGVGSIACMTLEIEVYQKLMDDFAEADITGMPKYKVNNIVLFMDAEDVARMGYPGIMSVEQYTSAKLKRLMDVFKDAKTVGAPISLNLGSRCGRSSTVTFTYEGMGCVVKAMLVCTLVGNTGISALYFTKLGGGLFDVHLYLYQQLLKSIVFRAAREESDRFSRFQAVQIRLTDQDLPRCYTTAAVNEKKTLERHLKSLHQSTDGRTEGRFVAVDVSKGGLPRSSQGAAHGDEGESIGRPAGAVVSVLPTVASEDGLQEDDDLSLISVSSIPHLAALPVYDENAQEDSLRGGAPPPPVPPPRAGRAVSETSDGDDGPTSPQPTQQVATIDSVEVRHDESKVTLQTAGEDDSGVYPMSANLSPKLSTTQAAAAGRTVSSLGETTTLDNTQQQQKLIQTILKEDDDVYFGPSLHDVYIRCCELQHCRPNSYLLKKLPSNPKFTSSVEELDLTSNYLGHNGFVAVLDLLEHLPRLHSVFFNDMSLDNTDVEHLCELLANNTSIRCIQLRNNTKITLPATKQLSKLLKANKRITSLVLHGTKIGATLIASLEAEAGRNRSTE